MSTLGAIPVKVELASGNVEPLIYEIGDALGRLLAGEPATAIDLRSLPLAPGEEERIVEFLGRGEVRAELDVLGVSIVQESRFAGVWVVTHHDAGGAIVGRLVEIGFMPEILRSQAAEMGEARERLLRELTLMRRPSTRGEVARTAANKAGTAGPA